MWTQLVCLLIGMVLPYIWAASSLPFRSKQFGKPDINEPRVQAEQLSGAGARAVGAQANAWEALILFAVANLAAWMAGVEPVGNWGMAALIWAGARVGHGIFYIMGLAALRVLAFVIGTAMSFWIMVMALSV
ncbi:MAG: MAPEG family protein [Pseudomonadales bacterium]|jgi:uncharacterized MAPEG superfamily protein